MTRHSKNKKILLNKLLKLQITFHFNIKLRWIFSYIYFKAQQSTLFTR